MGNYRVIKSPVEQEYDRIAFGTGAGYRCSYLKYITKLTFGQCVLSQTVRFRKHGLIKI